MDADRASLFLVDNKTQEIYARIFDINQQNSFQNYNNEHLKNIQINQEGTKEIR